ncbi:hypothetical protein [Pseudomonas sp. W03]|uniref:hypothetical protein n=1 Tax=Pseudomonas sp. W03 TaxID=3090666 RepID=UPI003A4DB546
MSIPFTLSDNSLTLIAAQLELNGRFRHTCRSAYGQAQIELVLEVERGLETTEAVITIGGQRHSLTLNTRSSEKAQQLADFIDAITNSRVDSAEPAPPRILRQVIAPESPLDTEQQESIRGLVRRGGFLELKVGLEHPVLVMVHRTFNTPGICTILSVGARRPRTVCWTIRNETDSYCAKRLQESVEHLITLATPKPAKAA